MLLCVVKCYDALLYLACEIAIYASLSFFMQIVRKIELLHAEVNDVLQAFEKRITTSECEPVKTSIYRYIMELKDLLIRERNEYDVSFGGHS